MLYVSFLRVLLANGLILNQVMFGLVVHRLFHGIRDTYQLSSFSCFDLIAITSLIRASGSHSR